MSDGWATDHEKHYRDTQEDLDTARDLIEVLERERDYYKERDHLNRRLVWSARERAEKAEKALQQAEQNIAMRQQHHIEEDLPEIKALQERVAELEREVEGGRPVHRVERRMG